MINLWYNLYRHHKYIALSLLSPMAFLSVGSLCALTASVRAYLATCSIDPTTFAAEIIQTAQHCNTAAVSTTATVGHSDNQPNQEALNALLRTSFPAPTIVKPVILPPNKLLLPSYYKTPTLPNNWPQVASLLAATAPPAAAPEGDGAPQGGAPAASILQQPPQAGATTNASTPARMQIPVLFRSINGPIFRVWFRSGRNSGVFRVKI